MIVKVMPKQASPKFPWNQLFNPRVQTSRPMNEQETSLWRGQALGFAPKNNSFLKGNR
jgi:hypothetical protein